MEWNAMLGASTTRRLPPPPLDRIPGLANKKQSMKKPHGHGQGQQHLHDDPTTLAASCMRWVNLVPCGGLGAVRKNASPYCKNIVMVGAGLTQILNCVPVRTQLREDGVLYRLRRPTLPTVAPDSPMGRTEGGEEGEQAEHTEQAAVRLI